MTLKRWRGDAPEVAQVSRVTPVNVQIGNQFSIVINGKPITVTAVTASAAAVCTLLRSAIAASPSAEFQEFSATVDGGSLVLTASTAGVPFVLTAGSGNGTVVIERVQAGFAGSDAVQVLAIPVTLAGTFTITWDDQTTTAIAAGASAGTVETALQALSRIGTGNCTVSRATSSDGNDYLYTLTFVSGLGVRPIAPVIAFASVTAPWVRRVQLGAASGTFQNEVQEITVPVNASNFTITKDSQTTVSFNAQTTTVADIQTAIENLSSVATGSVLVSRTITDVVVLRVEFQYLEGDAEQTLMTVSTTLGAASCPLPTPTITEVGVASKDETQTVTEIGAPTGGTFTLTFGGYTTTSIAWNAAAATVQTALEALTSIGSGNATVSGSAGGPWTVTFAGTLAAAAQSLITTTSSLTGGVTDSVTIVTTTDSGGPNHYDDARNWSPLGVPANGDDVLFEGSGGDCLYGLDQSAITLNSLTVSMTWANRKLGLPAYNSGGYQEYRTKELKISADAITIGTGTGTGPSRIYLDTGTVQTAIEILNTGSSADTNSACYWIGNHASNTIIVRGGDFGTAPYADQSATVATVNIFGGTTVLNSTAIGTSMDFHQQRVTAYGCTLGGFSFSI